MKRFAANFLFDLSGTLLKNGIIEADESGNIVRITDTKGNLRESGQLNFQSGILIPEFEFAKTTSTKIDSENPLLKLFLEAERINIHDFIEAGKTFQEQYPGKTILQFFQEANEFFSHSGIFQKIERPGIFLLIGSDLLNMKFTPKSRLKKLL